MSILKSIKEFGSGNAQKSSVFNGVQPGEVWHYSQDGNGNNYFKYECSDSSLTAYRKCSPVTAIINKKVQAFINGNTWLLNVSGKAKDKVATSEEAKKIMRLVTQPNPVQSAKQFEAQNYIYQQLAGYVIVLPIKPSGFPLNEATSLWNIPPHMLEIKEKAFKPRQVKSISDLIESITLVTNEDRTPLDINEIIIIKDFSPSFSSVILPESRIKSLEMPINNIIGAYESRNVLIKSRGPMYVISSNQGDESGRTPLLPRDSEQLKTDFKTRYGLTNRQSTAIITNANIRLDTVGYPTKDLLLFEEIEGSTMALCDNFGYPYRLMAAEKSASYNDVSEFKKMLYQDTIIPESQSIFEQWDNAYETAKFNLKFNKDFSHVAILQEDAQRSAAARKTRNDALLIEWRSGQITLNDWRIANNEDPMADERGQLYFPEYTALYGDPQKGMQVQNNNEKDAANTN